MTTACVAAEAADVASSQTAANMTASETSHVTASEASHMTADVRSWNATAHVVRAAAVASTSAAAVAAAFLEPTTEITCETLVAAETVALVPTATAAITFAPFIKTHIRPNLICPPNP